VNFQPSRNPAFIISSAASVLPLLLFSFAAGPLRAATIETYTAGLNPWGVVFDGANIWVSNGEGVTVTEIQASTGKEIGSFGVQSEPHGILFDGTNIWVANNESNTVSKVLASTGVETAYYSTGNGPQGVAFDGTNIWVSNMQDGTVTELVAANGKTVGTYTVGNSPNGVVFDGTNIWVANNGDGTVSELQASTGNVINTYTVGNGPYGVVFDGSHICVTNVSDGTVSELSAATGATIGTYPAGTQPVGIVFDGTNLWVADFGSNQVTELLASTGAVVGTYPAGAEPREMAFDGTRIWVTDFTGNSVTKITPPITPAPSISTGGVVPINSRVTTIQQGEWVTIFGTNLASSPATWNPGTFPTTLGNTTVTIDGKAGYLLYVSPGQINVQAPDDTTTGLVSVTVTTGGGTATGSVTLAPYAPSFSLLGDGKHVAGIIIRTDGSGAYQGGTYDIIGPTGNSLGYATVAAKAGDNIELFAVGLGPTSPVVPAGQEVTSSTQGAITTSKVALTINNVNLTPAPAAISEAGLYQINLTVPSGLGTGDVPLVATVGGSQTPANVVIALQ
jgi:uncharacterized protein (TIGR03437 family)